MSKFGYEFENDVVYCYPNSSVLINKLNIKDEKTLYDIERKITSLKLAQANLSLIPGNFDFKHLCDIHKFLFKDIYNWAGEIRTVNISKGTYFCKFQYIENYSQQLFSKILKDFDNWPSFSFIELAKKLSYVLAEINAIHPFREGNGRTQRLYILMLAAKFGYHLDYSSFNPKKMLEASMLSFHGDNSLLEALMMKSLSKK